MRRAVMAAMLAAGPAGAAPHWMQVKTAHAPSAREGMSAAFDPVSGRLLLVGGYDGTNYLNDTWAFDGHDWTLVATHGAPLPRTAGAMAYDAPTHKMVLFGGFNGQAWLGDTWVYDPAAARWTEAMPKISPRAGTGPAVFTDPAHGHVIEYGGFDGALAVGYSNQTLRWRGTGWKVLGGTAPLARAFPAYAADPASRTAVVFGGLADINPDNTWTWNGLTWQQVQPALQPPLRFAPGMACDAAFGGCVMFGGDSGGQSLGDAWLWSPGQGTWSAFAAAGSPGAREAQAMVFDTGVGGIVVFGGLRARAHHPPVVLGDTWVLQH